jgi:hypothetical protein
MDWQPISTAPTVTPCVVSNRHSWTVARRIWRETQTLQFRWPLIKSGGEWAWVYMPSNHQKIDFEPTHWAALNIDAPPAVG